MHLVVVSSIINYGFEINNFFYVNSKLNSSYLLLKFCKWDLILINQRNLFLFSEMAQIT